MRFSMHQRIRECKRLMGRGRRGPRRPRREVSLVGARGIAPPPTTFRSRCASPSRRSRSTGCGPHDATASPRWRCHRSRSRCRRRRPRHRIGEGGGPPPGAVALDRQAPPGERSIEAGGNEHRAARLDSRLAPACARRHGPAGRLGAGGPQSGPAKRHRTTGAANRCRRRRPPTVSASRTLPSSTTWRMLGRRSARRRQPS